MKPTIPPLSRRLFAEFLGTAMLVMAVIGSGIMASTLSPDDVGLQLLENAVATGAALVAIILAVGPVSGAHLNPVVSLADYFLKGLGEPDLACVRGGPVRGRGLRGGDRQPDVRLAGGRAVDHVRAVRLRCGWRRSVATFGLLLVIFG